MGFRPKSGSGVGISALVDRKTTNGTTQNLISANLELGNIWAYWFSKKLGLDTNDCVVPAEEKFVESKISSEVLSYSLNPEVRIVLTNPDKCLQVIGTGLNQVIDGPSVARENALSTPFWYKGASSTFENLASTSPRYVYVGDGDFADQENKGRVSGPSGWFDEKTQIVPVRKESNEIKTTQNLVLKEDSAVIDLKLYLDEKHKDVSRANDRLGFYVSSYRYLVTKTSCFSGGWNVKFTSSSSWTATYSRGGCSFGGLELIMESNYTSIPIKFLLEPESVVTVREEATRLAAIEQERILKAQADARAANLIKVVSCKKVQVIKKVKGIKPKCPSGYSKVN
jgi:hypothetical protein